MAGRTQCRLACSLLLCPIPPAAHQVELVSQHRHIADVVGQILEGGFGEHQCLDCAVAERLQHRPLARGVVPREAACRDTAPPQIVHVCGTERCAAGRDSGATAAVLNQRAGAAARALAEAAQPAAPLATVYQCAHSWQAHSHRLYVPTRLPGRSWRPLMEEVRR